MTVAAGVGRHALLRPAAPSGGWTDDWAEDGGVDR